MKKFLVVLLCIISLTGCASSTYIASEVEQSAYAGGYFTEIAYWSTVSSTYRIVYANDTKVKYLIVTSNYTSGITPLYNEDGTLQLYTED